MLTHNWQTHSQADSTMLNAQRNNNDDQNDIISTKSDMGMK